MGKWQVSGCFGYDTPSPGTKAGIQRSSVGLILIRSAFGQSRWRKLSMSSQRTRDRVEALKKEEARVEGNKATTKYHADRIAMRQKTARLRALRLARDEVNKKQVHPLCKERSA
jgi:hypothetical protein